MSYSETIAYLNDIVFQKEYRYLKAVKMFFDDDKERSERFYEEMVRIRKAAWINAYNIRNMYLNLFCPN